MCLELVDTYECTQPVVVVCDLDSSDNGLQTQSWVYRSTLVIAITGAQAFVSKTIIVTMQFIVILPAKHACILRMWLCAKWHATWLCGVHRTRRDGSHEVTCYMVVWCTQNAPRRQPRSDMLHGCVVYTERAETAATKWHATWLCGVHRTRRDGSQSLM